MTFIIIRILPDDTKLIKVASPALSSKWFFKTDHHWCYTVTVPDWTEDTVTKPGNTHYTYISLTWNGYTERKATVKTYCQPYFPHHQRCTHWVTIISVYRWSIFQDGKCILKQTESHKTGLSRQNGIYSP